MQSTSRPTSPKATFVLKELPLPSPLPDDSLLLQTLYISNDPAFRLFVQADAGAVNRSRKKIPGAEKGTPMKSVAVLRVLRVGSDGQDNIKEGDIVQAVSSWSEYTVLKKADVTVVQYVPVQLQRRSVVNSRRSLGKSRASGRRVRSVLLVSLGYPRTFV